MSRRRSMWMSSVFVVAIVIAACTSQGDDTTTTAPDVTTTTVTSGSSTTTTAATDGTSPTTTTTIADATTSSSTTTTTRPRVTTTTAAPVTTTIPAGNRPPTVQILAPAPLSAHIAAYDAAQKDFGAYVELSAKTTDPDGDPVEVRWSASTQGSLGTGSTITVWLSTGGSDATQPVITATAVDQWGTEGSASLQIIVWIPSDA